MDTGPVLQRFFLEFARLRNVPAAANPKRAMLITMKTIWTVPTDRKHPTQQNDKAQEEKDIRKTAVRITTHTQKP